MCSHTTLYSFSTSQLFYMNFSGLCYLVCFWFHSSLFTFWHGWIIRLSHADRHILLPVCSRTTTVLQYLYTNLTAPLIPLLFVRSRGAGDQVAGWSSTVKVHFPLWPFPKSPFSFCPRNYDIFHYSISTKSSLIPGDSGRSLDSSDRKFSLIQILFGKAIQVPLSR